jgi:ATP-dependent Zn protease
MTCSQVILISATLLWQVVKSGGNQSMPEISYSEFLSRVSAAKISKVTISGTRVVGESRDGTFFRVVVPANQQAMLLAALWFFMIRQLKSKQQQTSISGS